MRARARAPAIRLHVEPSAHANSSRRSRSAEAPLHFLRYVRTILSVTRRRLLSRWREKEISSSTMRRYSLIPLARKRAQKSGKRHKNFRDASGHRVHAGRFTRSFDVRFVDSRTLLVSRYTSYPLLGCGGAAQERDTGSLDFPRQVVYRQQRWCSLNLATRHTYSHKTHARARICNTYKKQSAPGPRDEKEKIVFYRACESMSLSFSSISPLPIIHVFHLRDHSGNLAGRSLINVPGITDVEEAQRDTIAVPSFSLLALLFCSCRRQCRRAGTTQQQQQQQEQQEQEQEQQQQQQQ